MDKAKKPSESEELLKRIRERYPVMVEGDRRNREEAKKDMRFALVPGEQWEPNQKQERGDRPCYEFNKIRVTGKRIVNDMRANRPQGKVRAVEDGDKAAAEALEGLARNIWHVSDGDTVIDYAAEHQVFGGMGAWRVIVDWSNDTAFEQDIRVEALRDPFCLFADPSASDPIKRDARDWILTEKIPKTEYEARWPKAEVIEFESAEVFGDDEDWNDEDRVRICEYWYKKPVTKTLRMLKDGRTVCLEDLKPEEAEAVLALPFAKERKVKTHDIYMCIASGNAILEGPTKFAGNNFPFVVVYGEWTVIDSQPRWCGITRFAKDAQRSYNVSRTAITETIAMAPQAKFWATPEQAKGHLDKWADAHVKNYPVMLFNPDGKNPGPPQRMGGADVPVALIQESQLASEEIKSVTGIFDASLGARSNETTGIAIRARQAQGEIATFNFADNMAKGIRRTWEILIDLIPKIYDTAKKVRVLGVDGAEKYLTINGQDPQTGDIVDITHGKYDVAITTGPGFSTQRENAAEIYTQMMQGNPALFPIAGDLIFKAMDLPYSDKMAERMKAMLPPQIQQLEAQGKAVPPEAQAAMAQADQAMQQVQQMSQLVQEAAAEAETGKQEAEKAKSEVAVAAAQLKVQEAGIAKQVAEFKALVAETQARMASEQAVTEEGNERESLSADLNKALAEMQQTVADFMQQSLAIIGQQQAAAAPQVVVPPRPRIVAVKKQNGMIIPIYEDQVEQGG